MSNNKTEEKFVTIPFDTWMQKYKPMAERNEFLEHELENRKINIFLKQNHTNYWPQHSIGYIEFDTSRNWFIKMDVEKALEEVEELLNTEFNHNKYYNSKKYAEEIASSVKAMITRIEKLPPFVKWLFRIKKF